MSPAKGISFTVALVCLLSAATFVLLELFSAVYFSYFSKHFYVPLYLAGQGAAEWLTDEPWGMWHLANARRRHRTPCFDVTYESNSIGARDVERKLPTPRNTTIFLGDSFIEGWGVRDEDRLSNVFERRTGRAAVNLASVGLGPRQYWMVYRQFSPLFAHDVVVVGLLPINDLFDVHNDVHSNIPPSKKGQALHTALRMTWTAGLIHAARGRLPPRDIDTWLDVTGTGYFDHTSERLHTALHYLESIIESSAPAKVIILIMPTFPEALALRNTASPWVDTFVQRLNSNRVTVIDLGPRLASLDDETLRSAYLPCDGHWSPFGHYLASLALLPYCQP